LSRYLIDVNGGRLFVGGTAGACDWFDFSNCDVLVRVYRVRNGALERQAQFDNAGADDDAHDLAVQGGNLAIVGLAERAAGPPFVPEDWDFLTLAYDARGEEHDD
jgi:hypothetical protein